MLLDTYKAKEIDNKSSHMSCDNLLYLLCFNKFNAKTVSQSFWEVFIILLYG